ncbi:MAG: hypothetical protein HWD61_10660 [Parachlamydiaceae bacterium]|nr:MAG: hypothetical protein HWD61_10660 [Parachlamydiaceae bacterium]
MIDHDVDLYIASFPYIGLKSCIEAMGAGIPLITHQNYSSQLLGGSFYSYPEAYSWKTPEELFTFLENLDPGFYLYNLNLRGPITKNIINPNWLMKFSINLMLKCKELPSSLTKI